MEHLTGYALQQFRTELEDVVGVDHVSADEDVRKRASIDQYWATFMWQSKGAEIPLPDFVVYPLTTAEVSRVVRICNTYKIPVIARGGGSGTQGGAATLFGGICLDLGRMDKVLDVDEKSLILTAQAGINGRVLEDYLNKRGLMLAHYPSSVDMASLGGYLAARGSGVMSTKYGKAEDMAISMEVVLADGTVLDTLTVPNHAAGPGLLSLFIGSEGTYGIITEVRMRLDPLPETRLFRVFEFPTIEDGLEAGRQIMTSRVVPAVIRLYDAAATEKALTSVGHKLSGVNMVVMVDGFEDIAAAQMAHIQRIVESNKATDRGEEEGRHWWEHRYDFYRPPLQPAYPQLYGTTETVTTYDRIAELYRAKKETVETNYAEWGARYTAHFSHWYAWGTMIYDRFYIDNPPQDAVELLRLHNQIWAECSRINLRHGGTLNEHHGIGHKLGWLMREQGGAGFEVLAGIKGLLDPRNILNPGKLGFEVN